MARKILFAILILAVLGFCLYTGPASDMTAVLISSLEDLTLPAGVIKVSGNEEIIKSVMDAINSGENIVHFDTSAITGQVMDSESIYRRILESDPELEYVEGIDCLYDRDRRYLTAVIRYRYFVNNRDVFGVIQRPGLYAVLDKRVLLAGESARIDLFGENASAYGVSLFSASPVIEIGKDNGITALRDGIAYLRVTVSDKYDKRKKYLHTFKIQVLPEDAPRIDDIDGLIAAAKQGLHRRNQPVLIQNEALRQAEIQKALGEFGEGLIISRLNDDMTAIENTTNSGASLAECADKIGILEEKTEDILTELIRPDMTDLQKVTVLYDYLIQNARYDYRVYDDPDNYPFDSGTTYGTLINGTGVCTSYAYALKKLLNGAGIECITILGNYMDEYHMWNIAKIDGAYYHLDPTFDSVFTHAYPGLSHTYFNQTDEQMRKDHDWEASAYPPCTGTRDE